MPIASTDLTLCTSANHPKNDTDPSGGAINAARHVDFTQFGSPARVALVSDGADTRVATVVFRDATGALVTETPVLTGAGEVLTTGTAERLLSVDLDSTSSTRTVTVKEGSGGTVRGTIAPNNIGFTALFIASASQSSSVNRYEKLHWKNNHGTLTLSSAQVTLTADPSSRIKIGLATSKGDTVNLSNRLAVPGGITFVDDNVAINVPTTTLAAGESIGTWIQEGLLSNDPPFKSTFTLKCSGVSS